MFFISQGIYKITNSVNGKFYIGSSVEIEKRFQQHKADLRNNHHDNGRLQNSFNKYGENSFSFEIIEFCDCDRDELRLVEQKYMDDLNVCDRFVGFNINKFATGGGIFGKDNYAYGKGYRFEGIKNHFFGKHHSDETKKMISESNSGENSAWFGKHHTEETKQKISSAHIGAQFSDEHRKNLSIAIKQAHKQGKFKTRIFSESDRKKQRIACIKGVSMFDKDMKLIKSFDSVTEAGKEFGINPENISRVCKGANESSCGYKWLYTNECKGVN